MLTKRQNLLETIRGGNPDRLVNQFEFLMPLRGNPFQARNRVFDENRIAVDPWGVTIQFKENTPGPFPMHDEAHKVVKDITKWKETVHAPSLDFPEEEWLEYAKQSEQIDRNEYFACAMVTPGVFEQLHYLMGMDDCLINFYLEPECMHELIDYITDWKLKYAELICKYLKPDALLHHDDWGSQRSTFLSPEMFEEFIVPAYKKLYGYYKEHGVELIVHHSDSYAATLVPYMIDMGIDIFQGCLDTNNIPELIEKYGGKISFMGGINNGVVDIHDWSAEKMAPYVEKMCKDCGSKYFIPCLTAGGPGSTYPGVYQEVANQIDRISKEMFG